MQNPPPKSFQQVVADGTAKVSPTYRPALARRMVPKNKPVPNENEANKDGPLQGQTESRTARVVSGADMRSVRLRARSQLEARDAAQAGKR